MCGRFVRIVRFQCIKDGADGFVSVLSHNLQVVEYRAVALYRLSDAVFQYLKTDTQVETMLNEGLLKFVKYKDYKFKII